MKHAQNNPARKFRAFHSSSLRAERKAREGTRNGKGEMSFPLSIIKIHKEDLEKGKSPRRNHLSECFGLPHLSLFFSIQNEKITLHSYLEIWKSAAS